MGKGYERGKRESYRMRKEWNEVENRMKGKDAEKGAGKGLLKGKEKERRKEKRCKRNEEDKKIEELWNNIMKERKERKEMEEGNW